MAAGLIWSRPGDFVRIVPAPTGRAHPPFRSLAGAVAVSVPVAKSQPVSESDAAVPVRTQRIDPRRNPSYPERIHVHERAHWQGVLAKCEERVAAALAKLIALGNSPKRGEFEHLYAQMLGARDQVADAARRLPMEVGDLYEEDRHRLEEAVAALDRLEKKWYSLKP
jgi:hypothetical protein